MSPSLVKDGVWVSISYSPCHFGGLIYEGKKEMGRALLHHLVTSSLSRLREVENSDVCDQHSCSG